MTSYTPQSKFDEWRQEQARIAKAPRGGGLPTPLSPRGFGPRPGAGMMGHLNTSSYAPAGPKDRISGMRGLGYKGDQGTGTPQQQFGVPSGVQQGHGPSKYDFDRPDQPPPWIQDVNLESIWYSPFEPVWPFGPPYYTRPREWNFPVGYNLNYIPERLAQLQMFRAMRRSWGVLATLVETRKDQLLRIPWTIQVKDKPRATSKGVDEIRKFFRHPDGKHSFGQWCRLFLDDVLVTDAPSLFVSRDLRGRPTQIEVLDGATIFPLIDDAGRRPDSFVEISPEGIEYLERQPAFQQIIYGLPMVNLDETELMYLPMRPLPEMPVFGFPAIEQILVEATEAIRKTFYQLEFWRDGSIPNLIITVPDAWSPRQIAMFQAHFDALLSGQLDLKSKVRFVPGGMKPFDIKNSSGESLWSQRDEILIRLACFAYSINPSPFVKMTNRSTAQAAQQQAQEEGLYPLMQYFKDDVMDTIIQDKFGFDDVEFVWLPRPEVDLLKQAQIHQIQLREGMRTVNEVREELGQEPVPDGNQLLIYVGNGAIPLEMAARGEIMGPGGGGSEPQRSGAPGKPASQIHPQPMPGSGGSASPTRHGETDAVRGSPTREHGSASPVNKGLKSDVRAAASMARKPTKGQKHAGNFKKGHVWIHGLNISIETPKGKKRHGHEPDGTKWTSTMAGNYGYIRGTIGADGDQVDVCVGPKPKSDIAFVIDQIKDDNTHDFDEHKIMLGFKKAKDAIKVYYDSNGDGKGPERLGTMKELSIDELKLWLKKGDTLSPISQQPYGTSVDVKKADTISSSTGLNWYDQTTAVPRRKKKSKGKLHPSISGPRWLELCA